MKLRQHGRGKPVVRRHFADEPSEPGEQIVDFSFVRKRPGGLLQWRGIADLQIDWQGRMARGDSSRVAVIDIIENDDLQYAARSLLPDTDTGVQCIPIGSHMRRWRLRAQNQPIKVREPRGGHAAWSFQGKFMPFGVTEFDQWSQRLQRRIATR